MCDKDEIQEVLEECYNNTIPSCIEIAVQRESLKEDNTWETITGVSNQNVYSYADYSVGYANAIVDIAEAYGIEL